MMGAAVLTTRSCLRAGAGLVTSHIPRFGYNILQTAVPEALISIDQSDIMFSEAPDLKIFDAVGVGPGLSCKSNSGKGLYNLLTRVDKPLVVDADAINILAKNPEWITFLPVNTIITPHPKEFDRLAGESSSMYERHKKQLEFAVKNKLIVVLKGAHTIISAPDGNSWINTTGNPGMASGGSGDVLTGIITSLLAQAYKPLEAAITGVFIHGMAADLALENQSEESLLSSDIIKYLGKAFIKIRHDNK
jgi:NAD(P)H-hydrate epimerase